MAAVLAAGAGAVLSHRAAAALWGIRPPGWLEVTAPARRMRPGVMVHTSSLPADEVTTEDGIPVTTVPRTLLDLAAVLPTHHLQRAANEAEMRNLSDPLSLPALLARYPRRPGAPAIRQALAAAPAFTRSELEARFVALCRKARLPPPAVNANVLGLECDAVWPEHRLIAELDGNAAHSTRESFERDRARDRALQAADWRVVRVTWRQLDRDAEAIVADLRTMLAAGPGARRAPARAAGP